MEYNCHFLTTSNVAGPLELAEPIIQELKLVVSSWLKHLLIGYFK
jgi:hypothetical protein